MLKMATEISSRHLRLSLPWDHSDTDQHFHPLYPENGAEGDIAYPLRKGPASCSHPPEDSHPPRIQPCLRSLLGLGTRNPCLVPHRKHSCRMASLQLEVSKDGKGQLEATGQTGKHEEAPAGAEHQSLSKSPSFGRNSSHGETGHRGGTIRGKVALSSMRLNRLLSLMKRHTYIHTCTSRTYIHTCTFPTYTHL